jgi:AcrR family transcriptional regulator
MLQAAGGEFAAHGFHRASMEAIAAAAGISKPMLYRYFGSKEGLYAAYVRTSGRELVDSVRAPETRRETPEARLRAGIRAFLTYVDAHRPGWTVLHGETTAPTDAQIALEVAELRGRIIRMLITLFGDESFAHAFAGAAESLATWWATQPRRSVTEATDTLMRIAEVAPPPDQS